MSTFKTQEVKRIVEVVYKAIIERRLPAGMRLIEVKLSEALKANRNHVRSALQELQNRGVVEIETNKGACVASPNRERAREVFEARRTIEHTLLLKAVENATEKDFATLQELINDEDKARESKSRPDMIRLSGEFHLEIGRIARNSVLTEMLDRLVAASSLIIGLYEPTNSAQCSNNEHQQLLELIRSGDALKASEFMDKHLEEIESHLLQPDDDDQEMELARLLTG